MIEELPKDEFSERQVLGIAIFDKNKASEILLSLSEDDFYGKDSRNRTIYNVMKSMLNNNEGIDVSSLASKLADAKLLDMVGGVDYLKSLLDDVTTTVNYRFYIKNLQNKTILRKIFQEFDNIESDFQTKKVEDTGDFVSDVERRITSLTSKRSVSDFADVGRIAKQVGAQIQARHGDYGITGLTTGFSAIDSLTNGLGNGELIILAARTGVGKSALGLNIALNAAMKTNRPVAIFSMEMSNEVIMMRILANLSNVDLSNMTRGYLNKDERLSVQNSISLLSHVPLYIDESSITTIDDIVLKSKKLKESVGDLALIVVDYIGLIDPGKTRYESEQVKISNYSRRLKQLATSLGVPVLCIAQLNRNVDDRDSKIPMLSDLRQSGAIEQDADKVLLLYSKDYYRKQGIKLDKMKNVLNKDNEEEEAEQRDQNGYMLIKVQVAKNRSGQTGSVNLYFNGKYQKFSTPAVSTDEKLNRFSEIDD
jgi:replicative DNA helicase